MPNLRTINLTLTKEDLKKSLKRDILIVQTIRSYDNLEKIKGMLFSNLRERYGYTAPLLYKNEDENKIIEGVLNYKKEDIGLDLDKNDLESLKEIVNTIKEVVKTQETQKKYLEGLMDKQCSKLKEAASALIGARLISLAGSLKHLAELPSSTIQVLGAEKALFRHIKTGAKAPKFGVIFNHELITNSDYKAKTARHLAAEISKATRIDYFRQN